MKSDQNLNRKKHQVLLVDDHPVTRDGIARLLNAETDFHVSGQAGTAQEAMHVLDTVKSDLAIVDISLGGTSGIELIKNLAILRPDLPVLVLSTHDEAVYAERALRAGAKGYVMKSEPTERILSAIRQVLDGKIAVSQRMDERLLNKIAKSPPTAIEFDIDLLSDREFEVFQLIGKGRNTAQIAACLGVSPNTVATHRAHIQQKLNVANLNALISHAAQWVQRQG